MMSQKQRIRMVRVMLGCTQQQLADSLGITKRVLQLREIDTGEDIDEIDDRLMALEILIRGDGTIFVASPETRKMVDDVWKSIIRLGGAHSIVVGVVYGAALNLDLIKNLPLEVLWRMQHAYASARGMSIVCVINRPDVYRGVW